jgi:tetratricopeptide (TPR) repeat protein
MWFRRRQTPAPVAEETQFIVPKSVTWSIDDLFGLERRGEYAEALKRWQILLTPFSDPQVASQISGMKSHRVIWLHVGLCSRHLERYDEALKAYQKAEALAKQAGDQGMLAELQNSRGVVYRHQGKLDQSLKELSQGLRTAREAGETSLQAIIHDNIAHCYRLQGRREQALEEQRRAYAVFQSDPSAANPQTQGRVMANLGLMLVEAGQRKEGIALAKQGLEQSRQAGDLPQVALMTENLRALG